jgi:Icc-related predicted phosphoesterase
MQSSHPLPILLIADVHEADGALRRVAREAGTLIVLGDLLNWIDYRTYDGIVARVCGREFVAELVRLRSAGLIEEARSLWTRFSAGREEELRRMHDREAEESYARLGAALAGCRALVLHGNADRPSVMVRHLPATARYVDGEAIEVAGIRIGFVGGGLPLRGGIPVPGELTEDDLRSKLRAIGRVDVLCSHIPPAIPALENDVIAGRQRGSSAILEYVVEHQPSYHFFGDVHQPQAVTWELGGTTFRNVGYFRATGSPLLLRP